MYRNMCIDVLGISVYGVRPVDKNTAVHERKNVSEKFVVSEFICIFVYQNKTKQQ